MSVLRLGDCLDLLGYMESDSVDMTVTSPPYDNMRTYAGSLNDWGPEKWQAIIRELWRVTGPGGTVAWVVGDATIGGSETGTSFRQALYAMDCGFRLHDTMIWNKGGFSAVGALVSRYAPVFEYVFIWSKGAPKTFNPIKDRPNKRAGARPGGCVRQPDGTTRRTPSRYGVIADFGQRFNVWEMLPVKTNKADSHPAPFPLPLATDLIRSWTAPDDLVLDPFLGSGTTGVAALELGRRFIGFERVPRYFEMARTRIIKKMIA